MKPLLLLPLVLLSSGCEALFGASCGDVGRAISEKTLDCEGSSSMGIGRARALQFTYACPLDRWWDPGGASGACVDAIADLDCDTARAYGDDLEAWLSTSAACDDLQPTLPLAASDDTDSDITDDTGGGDSGISLDDVPCSQDGGAATSLTITNQSGTAVDLFWRDGACTLNLYATLASGDSYVRGTFTGHVWVARELTGSRPVVDWYQTAAAPDDAWTVSR